MFIHTNGTESYCKENTCPGKELPCNRMNADISSLCLKIKNTKSRHIIFVFMRFHYLIEFFPRMKIGFNQIFWWLKNIFNRRRDMGIVKIIECVRPLWARACPGGTPNGIPITSISGIIAATKDIIKKRLDHIFLGTSLLAAIPTRGCVNIVDKTDPVNI